MATDMREQVPDETIQASMIDMIYGLINTQLVYIAAKLGIADLVADGPKSIDQLAGATGTHAPTLRRVLRLLVDHGVFILTDEDHLASNTRSEFLRSDVPESLQAMAEYYGAHWNWASWGNLLEALRTGKTAFDIAHGAPLFEYLERDADAAEVFDRYMAAMPTRWRDAVVAAYDFSGKNVVVDVGGGLGKFLIAVLQANPGLRGLLFDRADVLTRAQALVAAADVADRCNCVAGDLFEGVPSGGDVYFLSNIIHDWDNERAGIILRNCRRAMPAGSLLLIREQVLPAGAEPSLAKRTDVVMLALTGGRQRTESEFRSLLNEADLLLTRVVPLGSGSALIEAAPV